MADTWDHAEGSEHSDVIAALADGQFADAITWQAFVDYVRSRPLNERILFAAGFDKPANQTYEFQHGIITAAELLSKTGEPTTPLFKAMKVYTPGSTLKVRSTPVAQPKDGNRVGTLKHDAPLVVYNRPPVLDNVYKTVYFIQVAPNQFDQNGSEIGDMWVGFAQLKEA